jgi:putative tricarboxylic transport membrane protein
MKRPWQIASFLFTVLSVIVLIHSFSYPYKDRLGPGPGFFPFWMSIITGLLSMGLFLQLTFAKSANEESKSFSPNREGAIRIIFILASLGFVLIFLNPLGFRLTLLCFLLLLPVALGVRNWIVIPIVAVAGSFGVFHVFYYWLKLPLPIGIFGI